MPQFEIRAGDWRALEATLNELFDLVLGQKGKIQVRIVEVENLSVKGNLSTASLTASGDITAGGNLSAKDLSLSAPSQVYNLQHDNFAGYEANEHVDHTAVSIQAGDGLSGGGTIDATRIITNVDKGSTAVQGHENTYDHSKLHDRLHAINSASDHSSSIAENYMLKADANGLPAQAAFTESDIQELTGSSHGQLHAIDSTEDHTSTITAGYILKADTNGLPAQGSCTDSDVANAVSKAHDAVTVVDGTTVDLTLTGQQLTAEVKTSEVNHNQLKNYSANEHIDHTTVEIQAGDGLSGGGAINQTRTLINIDKGSTAVSNHTAAYDHTLLHARQHSIASVSDHTSSISPGYLLASDANGLPEASPFSVNEILSCPDILVRVWYGG